MPMSLFKLETERKILDKHVQFIDLSQEFLILSYQDRTIA